MTEFPPDIAAVYGTYFPCIPKGFVYRAYESPTRGEWYLPQGSANRSKPVAQKAGRNFGAGQPRLILKKLSKVKGD